MYYNIDKIVLKFHIHTIGSKNNMAYFIVKNVPSVTLFAWHLRVTLILLLSPHKIGIF